VDITVRNGDHGREVVLSTVADWPLFDEIAAAISTEMRGGWVERVDGLDERYWELRVDQALVTLHLQHYLGIMLFVSTNATDRRSSEAMVDRLAVFLTTYRPSRATHS
jgi:hypothetical protein